MINTVSTIKNFYYYELQFNKNDGLIKYRSFEITERKEKEIRSKSGNREKRGINQASMHSIRGFPINYYYRRWHDAYLCVTRASSFLLSRQKDERIANKPLERCAPSSIDQRWWFTPAIDKNYLPAIASPPHVFLSFFSFLFFRSLSFFPSYLIILSQDNEISGDERNERFDRFLLEGVKRGIIKLEIWNNNIDNFVIIFIFEIIGIQNSTNRTIFNKIFEIFLIKIPSPNRYISNNSKSNIQRIDNFLPNSLQKKIKKVLQFSSTNSLSYTLPIRFITQINYHLYSRTPKGARIIADDDSTRPLLSPSLLHPGEKMAIRR